MNFYQSYTDKSLIMRLIVDALYCKRKIMKKQILIKPELVLFPRRKLNRAPQIRPNSMTNSVHQHSTNSVIWLSPKIQFSGTVLVCQFFRNSTILLRPKLMRFYFDSLYIEHGHLYEVPITRTFVKIWHVIYLHSINLGDAIKYVIPKFWFE